MTYDKQIKDAIRSTGLVTNEQAWTCSDAVMKLPVWDRVIALEEALRKVARWQGEFPPSGSKWEDGSEMSYSAAHGSNGERDYMRNVALQALNN